MTFELWTLSARLCIFSLYISLFAPVISASIHRYVNYSDIQFLMMVTETETLTSTLNHNKFTYLDYVFLLSSYCWILIHIYFHTVLSEKQVPNTILHDGWLQNDLHIWKFTCRCVFPNKQEILSRFFVKYSIFKYVSTCQTRSDDFWIMNTMCTFYGSFRCIFLICSCLLSKHPSLSELFWYPSPDDCY